MNALRLISNAGLVLLVSSAMCVGQSLADAARQNRQKKETNGTTTKKVYTSDNLTDHGPTGDQSAKDLTGTWSFTHLDDRFQGEITLRQSGSTLEGTWHTSAGKSEPDTPVTGRVDGAAVMLTRSLGTNQQDYTLTLSADGNRLDGFGEGFFLHHSNLNMTRSGNDKPATTSPGTNSAANSPKH